MLDMDFYHTVDEDEVKNFNIMLFGKTKENKSVYVNVEGFHPYFYIELNSAWRKPIIDKIIKDIKETIYPKTCREGLLSYKMIQKHKFSGFTNEELFNFLFLEFKDYDSMKAFARAFEKKQKFLYISRDRKVSFKLYESNMNPILRFLHHQNLDPVGWMKIEPHEMKPFKENQKKGQTDINVACHYKSVKKIECSDIHKFTILSFDIECTSSDGKFPQPERDGDKIIQIGMTYSYLGESECYKRVMLCLEKTSSLSEYGIEVKWFKTEAELLLAFTKMIIETDPDIITGYNIFGFDFNYMMKRAKKFNIFSRFSRLGRIQGEICKFIEQDLSSSALGKNKLKYYQTPGRVCIDLMKVVQRDHKLSSYKLDSVASTFIRDKIKAVEYIKTKIDDLPEETKKKEEDEESDDYSSDEDTKHEGDDDLNLKKKKVDRTNKKKILYTKLLVKSTFGIKNEDYISIYYNDNCTDNRVGNKYKILAIEENKSILVAGKVRINPMLKKNWKVFWCQAKDDIEPKDIFAFFKQNPKKRAEIAKYCDKDCTLCNRLMSKLQILPNSIGMANVCCVPLSYLFLRGQGIKIFSLVARQCREENYVIPTVKKKIKKDPNQKKLDEYGKEMSTPEEVNEKRFEKFVNGLMKSNDDDDDDDDDDEDTYEGATVYDPDKGVHYDPIIVFDYGSLYPSSMIMKNLSHNSIILDEKYKNLPGYIYHTQTYNNGDGSTSTYEFAEKADGTKATIPRILMKLLAERKKYKKLLEVETDPFKKAVWDGLQNAYKVTANSLYGQCGAPTSAIFMKPIAACTTAIGRDMLGLGKDYIENIMPVVIRLAIEAVETKNDSKYLAYMREFYKEVKETRLKKVEKDVVIYEGKEQYFQFVKKELHGYLHEFDITPKTIYGDTDSVFFKLQMINKKTGQKHEDVEALKLCIAVGKLTSDIINNTLKAPQVWNYEKVYWPFVIISKKRYVGNLYVDDAVEFYQKSMGLVMKRRDNADIVKVMVGGIIDQILNKRDSKGAVKFTQDTLLKIITGKYKMDKFCTTKTLKDKEDYKNWTAQPHVVLADRIAKRDPGNKFQSNDRIPFAYIETKFEPKLQGDRVEHPQYIIENGLKLDFLFYITNQIMKPSLQFLELIAQNPDDIFNAYIVREQNRRSGTDPIMSHFQNTDCDNAKDSGINFGEDIDRSKIFDDEKKDRPKSKKTSRINRKDNRKSSQTNLFKENKTNNPKARSDFDIDFDNFI